MGIIIYNRNQETHHGCNNYPIYRPSILGNPYTHKNVSKTLALYKVGSREEAIEKYSQYFDMMYHGNVRFREMVDEIYDKYKNGEEIFLECYCKPLPCHGDVIKAKLEQRLIKEKLKDILKDGNTKQEEKMEKCI